MSRFRSKVRFGLPAVALGLAALAGGVGQVTSPPPVQGYDPLATELELAEAERAAGRSGAALEAVDRALSMAPRDPSTRLLRATLLESAGRHAEAVEAIDALVAERGASARALTVRGRAYMALGRSDLAERDLRDALALYPASGPARAELIELLRVAGRGDEARVELTRLRLQAPDLAWAVASEARLRADAGNADAVLAELELALRSDDALGSVRRAAIEIALANGRDGAAARAAGPWLARPADAPDAEALVLAARAARATGAEVDALRAALAALARDGASPGALDATVELLGRSDDLVDALLRDRLERGGDPAARAWMARRALDDGRVGEALQLLGPHPATPELRLLTAEALRRTGREVEAVALLDPLCTPDGPARAFYERALARFARAELELAAADFERAARGELTALAQFNRGAVLDRMARYSAAAEAYEAAVQADPTMGQAWVQLGNAYHFRLGDRERAAAAYRRFLEVSGEDAQVRTWLEEVE